MLRSLGRLAEILGRLLEDPDELRADDLALLLRIRDSLELAKEATGSVDDLEADLEVAPEEFVDRIPLAEAQEAVVDKDAGELVTDRLVDEGGCHGGIDPSAQAQNDTAITDLIADLGADALNEGTHGPVALAAANAVKEVLEDCLAPGGVVHLGMKLHAIDLPLRIRNDGVRGVLRGPDRGKALGQLFNTVAMAVPDIELLGQSLEKRGGADRREDPFAIFPVSRAGDRTAEIAGEKLHPVADAEDRKTEFIDRGIDLGSLWGVDARGTAREDDPLDRAVGDDLAGLGGVGNDLGKDAALANAAGDYLGVLGAKVEDDDLGRCLRGFRSLG